MADRNQDPEQKARDTIDAHLNEAGWTVQHARKINFNAGLGIAVREYQTDVGPVDYALFVDRKAVGVIEAKPEELGHRITMVEEQSGGYAHARLKWVKNTEPLPFVYESTGVITRFTDGRDPKPRSREVFSFHRPETLQEWSGQATSLRGRLQTLPALNHEGLRDCQITALENLEASFKEDHPRALIQMATGAGKTFTAITSIYRLLKYAGARRVLFLVDTKNLGEQAEQEFMTYLPNDDNRKFEQMKGRGTRTLDHDNLKKVTPSATTAKTHFVIVDAIGVTKSLKTASQPLITKPSVSLKDLAMGVMMGARDEDTVSSLAGRLARLDKMLNEKEQLRIQEQTGGITLGSIISELIDAIEPDRVDAKAREMYQLPLYSEPNEAQLTKAQEQLVGQAVTVFNGELVDLLENIRRDKEQTIDNENLDSVMRTEWEGDAKENAQALVRDFQAYLEANRDEIEALTIFYSEPARRQTATYEMIRQVMDRLKQDRPRLAPLRVWQAYAVLDDHKGGNPVNELTALVSLIRRACGIDTSIAGYSETLRRNFQNWIMQYHSGGEPKFNKEQMEWLHMIRDYIINSFHIERDDLETSPFDAKGGMGKMYQLFGDTMDNLIDELNGALAV